jgi:phosphoserine phosphatase
MLAVVGHPTACNPDFRLRSLARSYDWPILELDEDAERSVARRPQGLARKLRKDT